MGRKFKYLSPESCVIQGKPSAPPRNSNYMAPCSSKFPTAVCNLEKRARNGSVVFFFGIDRTLSF